ncbi:MAG: hypothetical protein AAFX76_13700, partial [Planctomycetota bacterium]
MTTLRSWLVLISVLALAPAALAQPRDDGGEEPRFEEPRSDPDREHRRGRALTDEQVDAALEIVGRLYPELSERLETLREEDPRKLRQTLQRRFPRVRFLVNLQDRDPAMFELRISDLTLERQTRELAERLRAARDGDDRDAVRTLRDEIEAKVAEHFDVRQSIRQREIELL